MVQGMISADMYPFRDKGQGDGSQLQEKNVTETRGKLRMKWKLFLSSAILITSVFVFTGTVIYLNMNMPNNCRKGCLTVHIIPYMHSTLNRISLEGCDENAIEDSYDYVVNELENDERRRFTVSEIHSLWKWWKNQTNSVKASVRSLINDGRLEIAGGGWCIPDEAIVHYRSFIDQFAWGLRRLEEISGRKLSPDVCFLMDNHGHSREIASLLKAMDFKGVMLGGISPSEQCYRRSFQKMEFLWSDGDFFGIKSEKPNLFTSILDDRTLKLNEYFVYEKPITDLNEMFNGIFCQAYGYASNNVFIPIGVNFQFKKNKTVFTDIESLMNSTGPNSKYKINIVYSTPTSYLNAVDSSNGHWWRSDGEFLPYIQGKFDSWTGYYSLRSSYKYFQRMSERFLQVLKQTLTLSNVEYNLTNFSESVALSQHHHAATTISGQSIAENFFRLLHKAVGDADDAINEIFRKLMVKDITKPGLRFKSCLMLNVSECEVTEWNKAFVVTVYNPSPRTLNQYIRVPVGGDGYLVRTSDGQPLKTQMVKLPSWVLSLPGRIGNTKRELVFRAVGVPPVGFKSYYVSMVSEAANATELRSQRRVAFVINEYTRKLTAITRNGEIYPIIQELKFYTSWFSNNVVFRPGNKPQQISNLARLEKLNDGELVTEYEQHFGRWACQVIRTYKDEDFIEFNWAVGKVPVSIFEGKEIVTSFKTNIRNHYSFYVDANGRGSRNVIKRPENENEMVGERIAKNYRPINSRIGIADRNYQLHLFNDRVQGGSSPFQGQLEVMLHRKFINLAVLGKRDTNQRPNEMVSGKHWVFIGSSKDPTLKASIDDFSSRVGWEPWYFFADATHLPFEEWKETHITEFSGVKKDLPSNLRILTMEPWGEDQILLRLENIGEDGCDKLNIDLQALFSGLEVLKAVQVSLTGNNFKEPSTSGVKFKSNPSPGDHNAEVDHLNLFIRPSEIKTVVLTVKPLH